MTSNHFRFRRRSRLAARMLALTSVGLATLTLTVTAAAEPPTTTPAPSAPATTTPAATDPSTPAVAPTVPSLAPTITSPPSRTPAPNPVRPEPSTAPSASDKPTTPSGDSTQPRDSRVCDKWVLGAIEAEYNARGGHGVYGCPTTDEADAARGGRFQVFERQASFYWHPNTGARQVGGLIRDKWRDFGWENGNLRYPTTSESDAEGGRFNHFEGGSIYWSADSGAHQIGGAIKDKWAALGWERGVLKFPTSDEFGARDGGRGQHFQGGSIYWFPSTGAHPVWGAIKDNWASRDWENGKYGYPTSDEYDFEDGKAQNFERGTIDWKRGDPATPAEYVNTGTARYKDYGYVDPTLRGPGATESPAPSDASAIPAPSDAPAETRGRDEGDEPDLGACGTQVDFSHASNGFNNQIHTNVRSYCPAPGMTGHEVNGKTQRLRWWGVPVPFFGGLPEADPKNPAHFGPSVKSRIKTTTAVWCARDTIFSYKVTVDGKFSVGGKQYTASNNAITKDVKCDNARWPH